MEKVERRKLRVRVIGVTATVRTMCHHYSNNNNRGATSFPDARR